MNFTINHARAVIGNDIYVSVAADSGKAINSARVELDGLELSNDQLSPPSDFYEHSFPRTGSAGPNMQHTLIISAQLDDNTQHSSTSIWSDQI
jgi:hypothetical protein